MVLILMVKGKRMHVVEVEDAYGVPEKMIHVYACPSCCRMHEAVFVHKGMHDDGEIYELKGLH